MVRTGMKALSLVVGLLVASSVIGWAAPSRAALVHLYTFTTDAKDSVGHLDGTLQGGASLSGGQVHLNPATSDYVFFGSNDIGTMPALTIETWGTYATNNTWATRIVEIGGSTFLDLTVCFAEMLGPGYDDYFPYYSDLHSVGTGTPVFVALTIAGTTMTGYVNGAAVGSKTLSHTLSAIPGNNMYLGRSGSGGGTLNGSIDEIRIYDNARSPADILNDYNAGPTEIPEPTALCLMVTAGLSGLLCYAWRKRSL